MQGRTKSQKLAFGANGVAVNCRGGTLPRREPRVRQFRNPCVWTDFSARLHGARISVAQTGAGRLKAE